MAKKVTLDGIKFDSKREADRYAELKMLEAAGEIKGLELQVAIPITINGVPIRFVGSNRHMKYLADFRYYDEAKGRTVYEDAKGHPTDVYKIKRALVAAMGIDINEV